MVPPALSVQSYHKISKVPFPTVTRLSTPVKELLTPSGKSQVRTASFREYLRSSRVTPSARSPWQNTEIVPRWSAENAREPSVMAAAVQFSPENSGRVSVFSAGDLAEGVTIRGLAYGLEQSPLSCDFPLGVSNAFTGQPAEISLSRGRLLVMWQQEAKTAVDRIRRGGQL